MIVVNKMELNENQMKRIFIVIFTGIIITSCGDTAQGPGEKAGEEHNR
jgi:hypothetical protein